MDQDSEFKARFRWPVQDRDRAKSPSTAPRASSVCSASFYSSRVFFEVDEMVWDRMEGGVASGFSRPLVHPDWRVMGDQDPQQGL